MIIKLFKASFGIDAKTRQAVYLFIFLIKTKWSIFFNLFVS